jgi:hypothetical protein
MMAITREDDFVHEAKASGVINPSEYSHYRLVEYSKLNSQISGLKYSPIAF